MDFVVPTDHRVKIKESEKREKYLDFARDLQTLQNMRETMIPFVIVAIGMLHKGWERRLEESKIGRWIETIQITALLISATIVRRVMETSGDLLSLTLLWKTIS